jgi:predicted DNA-binding transcriptional regulator
VNKDVNAYVNGELIMRDLLGYALKQKNPAKSLDDVKKEMREHFPAVEFKVEKTRR